MFLFLNRIKSKRLVIYFSLFSLVSACFLFLYKPEVSFRKITDQLFFEDITTDTLSLHYTLAYPAHYSINSYPLTLPKYDKNVLNQSKIKIENFLSVLSNMDLSKLSSEELYCQTLLKNYFSTQVEGFPYTYFEEYFSPSSGIPINFPVLMAEYNFRTKQDISDYLTILKDTPNYFNSYFSFQKERALNGYYLSSYSLQDTANQCNNIITKDTLEENTHFLQITFRERLAPLVAKKIISKKEAFQYMENNNNILLNIVLPSYQNLEKSLLSLQLSNQPLQGLYKKPQGKNYYQWLIKKQVGSCLSVPEILQKIETDFNQNLSEFRYLQEKIESFPNYEKYIAKSFPINNRNEILTYLQDFAKKDFPSLSSFSDKPIKTTIKSVSNCLEEYTSPAFYMIPPIDDIWKNTIYINNRSTPEGLDLFTTLAHEGYPGHLYQTVYYGLYSNENNVPFIRHIMNYEGYVEGWAIYCEFYSYDYATKLYPEDEQEFFSLWHRLLLTDRKLQLAILSILDINLHFYNDSLINAKNILSKYGILDDKTVTDIYRYVLEEPGNYLKYYLGYLSIIDLKDTAKSVMGNEYSDIKFHEMFLKAGPSDFDNLEKRLK